MKRLFSTRFLSQSVIVTRAERSPVFATNRAVLVCVTKDTAAPDAISASLATTAIRIADRVTAALSARPASAAILRANVHVSPTSLERPAASAVQDTTNTPNVSVCNSYLQCKNNFFILFFYLIYLNILLY